MNRRLIVYEKFNTTHQKTDQKVSVFKIYLKKIKKKLFSFDEYYKAMLFLAKLISVLKNKLFIMRDVLSTKKIILFKVIMQETTLNRTRDDDEHNHSSSKSNKFFKHQFNWIQQFDKFRHFSNSEKKNKSKSNFEASAQNKRTHAKIKNEKNNRCFKCHKSNHYHRDCSDRNKWSKTTVAKIAAFDAKNENTSSTS